MMFAYIYFTKPAPVDFAINDTLLQTLSYKGWGDPQGEQYSALDVLANPEKYPQEMQRIDNADLSYPIIVTYNNYIVDGVHRLTRAYLEKQSTVNAYVFDADVMRQFIIGSVDDWPKVDAIRIYQFIILYVKRFVK